MGDRRRPGGARQADQPAQALAERDAPEPGAVDQFGDRAERHPEAEQQAERRQRDRGAGQREDQDGDRSIASAGGAASRCVTATRSPRFQARNGPNGRTISSGAISAPKVRLKNGAPTEMVVPGQRVEQQRIERADQHRADAPWRGTDC